ncbi:DUF3857 domain-containing protein [Roseivirga pacifica]|uniref:DUF3857 domain-containing protein n=1 Tax=Roseivirga pacifica TaxID=1267423 RepID=UPI003BAF851D
MNIKATITTLFIFLLFSNCLAQVPEKPDYGEVSIEELEMTHYKHDSSASAVYLIDFGEATFRENDLAMSMEVHVRIKILDKDGLDYADLTLNYIKGETDYGRLKASIYNLEDGKVVEHEISKRDWITEKVNDRFWSKKVSFPNAKVGSVIEYTYRRNAGSLYSLPSWSFQSSIPVAYSEYKLHMPQYGTYQPKFQGYQTPVYQNTANSLYHIIMKDVPALTKEPYVSTIENYRSRVEFEIKSISVPGYGTEVYMENWNSINTEMFERDDLGGAINKNNAVRRIYPEEKSWKTDKESMVEIYDFVRDHFKWNNRASYRVVDSSKELWSEAEGDNADINITLAQFLKHAGFEVDPVILSTRGNGYVNKFVPVVRQFNYLILYVKIGEEEFLLDATDKFRPYNVLPSRALNGEGLRITANGPQWINLNLNNEINSKVISGDFSLNDDGALEGKMQVVLRSSSAADLRASLYEEEEKAETTEESDAGEDEESLDDYKTGEVENLEIKNVKNPEQSLEITYDFTSDMGVNEIGDNIFLNPLLIKMATENPFKLEERLYPVEFAEPIANTYIFKIKVPDGYEVVETPKPMSLVLPENGGKYMYTTAVQEGLIQIMVRFNLSKLTYVQQEYPSLKKLYELIIAKQEEQVVLKKKVE